MKWLNSKKGRTAIGMICCSVVGILSALNVIDVTLTASLLALIASVTGVSVAFKKKKP